MTKSQAFSHLNGLSRGQGSTVENVCTVMAWLSFLGGILAALMLGRVPQISPYSGMVQGMRFEPMLIATWLVSGVASALLWWVLARVGTILRYVEAMAYADPATTPVATVDTMSPAAAASPAALASTPAGMHPGWARC